MAPPNNTVHRYLLGILIILITFITRMLMAPLWETTAPFALFMLATVAAMWFGGRGPAVLVAIASITIRAHNDLHSGSLLHPATWEEAVRRVLFAAFLVSTVLVVERLRASARALELSLERARREIEERERVEAMLVSARMRAEETNRLKDEFLAMVSHELRTPLNVILGWAALLRSNTLSPRREDHAMEVIERNARHQAQLIGDLLDVARSLSGRLYLDTASVDLSATVRAAVESLREVADAKPVELSVTIDERPLLVWGDARRLEQIAWNLLSNGVKFTPSGGCVAVELRQTGRFAQLTVSDTGAGIAPEYLPHVFDRFSQGDAGATRSHGGLGLGLTIVRQLLELHRGSIDVESDGVNKGSRFIVTLPLHESNRDPDDLPASESTTPAAQPARR